MDPQIKTKVLKKLSYGVWVLSAHFEGEHQASTATWISQASFSPPLLMIALKEGTNLQALVEKSGTLCLHLLSKEQQELAGAFTKPTKIEEGKLGGIPHKPAPVTGAPLLEGFSAWLEAKVTDVVKRGDHSVFIVEVVNAGIPNPEAKPLELSDTPWYYGG
jgi:flavin reductase (DIM6/NTAB) family NADH-FMN oxidoreductase RutF